MTSGGSVSGAVYREVQKNLSLAIFVVFKSSNPSQQTTLSCLFRQSLAIFVIFKSRLGKTQQ